MLSVKLRIISELKPLVMKFSIATLAIMVLIMAGCSSKSSDKSTGPNTAPSTGYFVSPLGNDDNDGSRDMPFKTIQAGLDYAAQQAEPATVHIAAGVYDLDQSIQLRGGISMRGGYDPVSWNRDMAQYRTIIRGPQDMPVIRGYHQNSIRIDGFVIKASDGSEVTDNSQSGNSSIAVTMDSCFAVIFSNDSVVVGNASAGFAGRVGWNGDQGWDGYAGENGGVCPNSGGSGGFSWGENDGGNGANGGAAGGFAGSRGDGPDGGAGGSGGSLAGDGHNGSAGGAGAVGANGPAGISFGSLNYDMYMPADGSGGNQGTEGSGGGGGGSGGGSIVGLCGGGGGGGGSAGLGAGGGYKGGGGGAAIGFIFANYSNVTIDTSSLIIGNGGDGGAGGNGGTGGNGGNYGAGGDSGFGTGAGGHGGRGGNGGNGGHGGGGGGGPVIGILEDFTSTSSRHDEMITLGEPGVGGTSLGYSGEDGIQESYYKLEY